MSNSLLLDMVLALDSTNSLLKQNKVYIHPNIPMQKLQNAIDSYAKNVEPDDVMILLDDTLFGGAKDGLILTNDTIYFKPNLEKKYFLKLKNIESISTQGLLNAVLIVNGEKFPGFTQIEKSSLNSFCDFLRPYLAIVNNSI